MSFETLMQKISDINISPDTIKEKTCRLKKEIETFRIMSNTRIFNTNDWQLTIDHLAKLYSIIQELEIQITKATLFEFGSRHHELNASTQYSDSSNVCAYFSCQKLFLPNKTTFKNYFAFEPEYNASNVLRPTEIFLQQVQIENPDEYRRIIQIKELMIQKNINYNNIKSTIEKILTSNEIPILYSTDVLGYPRLDSNYPFWELPGLHIHIAYKSEASNIFGEIPNIKEHNGSHVFKRKIPTYAEWNQNTNTIMYVWARNLDTETKIWGCPDYHKPFTKSLGKRYKEQRKVVRR